MLGKKERERVFIENGSILLEKLVASCNSRPIPIRSFSEKELRKATNNYDPQLFFHDDGSYQWYNGSFEGRIISVKKYRKVTYTKDGDFPFTDIAISAKMNAHKNVLKLIGCCLETPSPALVFESAQNGTLADRIYVSSRQHERPPMAWQSKLKIAKEIAHTIAYLHTAFSRPIIHRDIKPQNIFFDQHDIPKLSDFSISVTIPEGEIDVVDDVIGAYGFLCPSYATTGRMSEKSDVYSFGTLLLELVTGKAFKDLLERAYHFANIEDYIRKNTINEIVESAIQGGEGGAGLEQQSQVTLRLALMCRNEDPELRPTMVDVTKELMRIERSVL